jgi:hypothetical protein
MQSNTTFNWAIIVILYDIYDWKYILIIVQLKVVFVFYIPGAGKSLARPTSLSTFFSVQGRGGSPTGPDP